MVLTILILWCVLGFVLLVKTCTVIEKNYNSKLENLKLGKTLSFLLLCGPIVWITSVLAFIVIKILNSSKNLNTISKLNQIVKVKHYKFVSWLVKDSSKSPSTSEILDDGFGNMWLATCPMCKKKSMQVVRPGKVQCKYCG